MCLKFPLNMKIETNNLTNIEKDLDFGKIFRLVLMQSKLIILITLLGFSTSLAVYFNSEKTYEVKSLLQVYSPNKLLGNSNNTIDIFSSTSMTSNIENITQLYKSRQNMIKVIEDQKLNIIFEENNLLNRKLFKYIEINNPSLEGKLTIKMNKDTYQLFDSEENLILTGTYNDKTSNKEMSVMLDMREPSVPQDISFSYYQPEKFFNYLKSILSISSSNNNRNIFTNQGDEILEVSLLTNDVEEGIKILNTANNFFIEMNIENDAEEAKKAISFLDQSIEGIERDLRSKKSNLKDFKEENKTIDVNLEITKIIENLNSIQSRIFELDLELTKASNSYTVSNRLYQDLLESKNTLEDQKIGIEQQIKNLPLAQQQYIDLFSDVQMNQTLYSELISKRLEYSIKEASTLGNIRIIDSAYLVGKVSPLTIIVILGTFISFILSLMVSIVRGLYFLPITNPAEIHDNNIDTKIIGVIPSIEDISLDVSQNEKFSQSLEQLVVNIKALRPKNEGEALTILLTSPTSGNGKTTIGSSLALKIQEAKEKVLLIDCDFKRGNIHTKFGIEKISKEDFLQINQSTIESYRVKSNLYVLPKISKLRSSFEFVYSNHFLDKLEEFKKYFDYIIIDTAPILSVSDTSIILPFSDVKLCMTRHSETKINEIKQSIAIFSQIGQELDGIIYNAYERPSSYYGYYGLYGNYAYQYYAKKYLYESYDYKKDTD